MDRGQVSIICNKARRRGKFHCCEARKTDTEIFNNKNFTHIKKKMEKKLSNGKIKKQTFISSARMNLAKNQANGKQIPEANLIFENYSYFSSAFLSKNNRTYFKKSKQRNKFVCIHEIKWLIPMKMKMKKKKKK